MPKDDRETAERVLKSIVESYPTLLQELKGQSERLKRIEQMLIHASVRAEPLNVIRTNKAE